MTIGITGTDGAGKGAIVEYLVSKHGFTHYSARALILEHIRAEGLPETRSQMRLTGNMLRKQQGQGFLVERALEKAAHEGQTRIVVESIRAAAEALCLKKNGGTLLAVDADQKLRYRRVQARRSESDRVSFEEFIAHEALERNDPDPHGMQKAVVIEMADYTLINNGTLEELHAQIETALTRITP